MKTIPFVDEGLGNSSYLIEGTEHEALVIDPDRRVDRYLRAAADRGLTIAAVLETHLHADFLSGAHELGARTGVPVLVPAGSEARFPHVPTGPDKLAPALKKAFASGKPYLLDVVLDGKV